MLEALFNYLVILGFLFVQSFINVRHWKAHWSSLRVNAAHCTVNGQGPCISLGGSVSPFCWVVCFCRRGILPESSNMAVSILDWVGEGGWDYHVSTIRLEFNTMVFSRVPHLPDVTILVFLSPESAYPLQRINLPSSSGVEEGQVPGCTGCNCALWNF